MSRDILVLYASQTGNGEELAFDVQRELERCHFVVRVFAMDDYDLLKLPQEHVVIFIASTTGQGDPPDNMRSFWRFLLRKNLPADCLQQVEFCVFGLGDSGYAKFNVTARKLHQRLLQLGATSFYRRGLGDEQHELGIEAEFDPWLEGLIESLLNRFPLPNHLSVLPDDALPPPRFTVTFLPNGSTPVDSMAHLPTPVTAYTRRVDSAETRLAFAAPVLSNRRLTPDTHEQEVRHIELSLVGSGLMYDPGDVLVVQPRNDSTASDELIRLLNLDPFSVISIAPNAQFKDVERSRPFCGIPMTVRELFDRWIDFNSIPKRHFFSVLSFFATETQQKEKLKEFSLKTQEGKAELYRYCIRERRTVAEVLFDFHSAVMPLEYLLETVPIIKPREFSISSSLRAHPEQVHITVAVIRYTTPLKRSKEGLCTGWLSRLRAEQGESIPIWIKPGLMRLPSDINNPIILIGPGTGVAPFRSFLQERIFTKRLSTAGSPAVTLELTEALASPGETTAESSQLSALAVADTLSQCRPFPSSNVLFFGCRYAAKDYLYAEEWAAYVAAGDLWLSVAFSRDQEHKIYVQQKLVESGQMLFQLIERGARIYVAGAAKHMPRDVRRAFLEILERYGRLQTEEAERFLTDMERSKRYVCESWS
eukprot:GILK01009822.1.p1 GENE.GILK01009822.1~~GILK01009822.1.p1  ORF type:complete len:649 (-),score=122.51 GILK01009822.1:47-1993(-)